MLAAAAQVLALAASVSVLPPSPSTLPYDQGVEAPPQRLVRVGAGVMISGGVVMAIGAGVIVPLSLGIVTRTHPPDPERYTAVAPFEQDLYKYQLKMYRAMRLGISGAITAGAGALVFIAGAVTWGAGKHRLRRLPQVGLMPSRGGAHGSLTLRF